GRIAAVDRSIREPRAQRAALDIDRDRTSVFLDPCPDAARGHVARALDVARCRALDPEQALIAPSRTQVNDAAKQPASGGIRRPRKHTLDACKHDLEN